MPFDEFAVYAGQVDLAEVDARPGMLDAPGHNVEKVWPLFGQFEASQGAFFEPGEQCRLPVAGERDHGGELPGLLPFANPAKGVIKRMHPDFRWKFIGSKNAVVDAAPHNAVVFAST